MIARTVPVTLGSPDSTALDVGDFNLVHARFPAGAFLPPHVHERATFGVMLTGGFDLAFPGRRFGCAPGSVFVEPAGERHSNRMAPHGAEVLAVQPAPGTAGEPAWAGFFARVSYRRHGRIAALATRVVTEVRRPDPFSALAAQALVVDMLVAALRGESKLAAQTLLGAAEMVLTTDQHPAQLKDAVASPGGTTIAGLHELERGGLRAALMNAVLAATVRSQELGRM